MVGLTSSARRFVLASAVVAAALAAVTVCAWRWQLVATAEVRQSLTAVQETQALAQQRARAAASAAAMSPVPWWEQLPSAIDADRNPIEQLSADALGVATKLGVEVGRLTFAPQPRANGAPYRSTAMQVELRGPYADVKRWLGELLARRPHSLALKSLDVRRAGEGAAQSGVTASVELRLYERAASTSP